MASKETRIVETEIEVRSEDRVDLFWVDTAREKFKRSRMRKRRTSELRGCSPRNEERRIVETTIFTDLLNRKRGG